MQEPTVFLQNNVALSLVVVASYGLQHPIGMGRGYPGYGAMTTGAGVAAGYSGAAPGPSPYGYGMYFTCLRQSCQK